MITLGIIGIVAALTMPSLIANYQKQVTVTRLKRIYNIMSQSVNLTIANEVDFKLTSNAFDSKAMIEQHILPHFKTTQICSDADKNACGIAKTYPGLNGVNPPKLDFHSTLNIAAKLADGSCIAFYTGNGSTGYVPLWVDVNCKSGPNIIGKDVFRANLRETKFELESYRTREALMGESTEYPCTKNSIGIWCWALIEHDGWEIKDDYPW